MNELLKFPFKAMDKIVIFLHQQESPEPKAITELMSVSHACYPDTAEVTQMLAYLTSFGQIKETSHGWIISHQHSFVGKKQFREHYLKDIISIITQLTAEPQSIEELSTKLNSLKEEQIRNYLAFLEKLTAFGSVESKENGWIITSYID